MKLRDGFHLAYCTNIHRGEDWRQTFDGLQRYTLAVRDQVCRDQPYAIGLRLSDLASRELSQPEILREFQRWLLQENCYVFTINGFPYGRFHGERVKEQVYAPDWTTPERLDYTNRLFDLLAELLPEGVEGSVSTVPGSFKEFITTPKQVALMRSNLWHCVDHISEVSARAGKTLHLGLEPEPLCFLETSSETVAFLEELRAERPGDHRLDRHLGVNYDACHLAVEFEDPGEAISRFLKHNVRVSKIHLSSALKVRPTIEARRALSAFADHIYFHQVIERAGDGTLRRYRDLNVALDAWPSGTKLDPAAEWRIHFHIPLHSKPTQIFDNTTDHLLAILDILREDPGLCSHLEMETYTWEVLPPELKSQSVVDQLAQEYQWTLAELGKRGLASC